MKTFFIAIVMFILWFIIGSWVGINFTLNTWIDTIINNVWTQIPKINVDDVKKNINETINKKKQQIIENLQKKKDEIINKIKEDMRKKLKEQIDKIFGEDKNNEKADTNSKEADDTWSLENKNEVGTWNEVDN